jgi:hypothetical protein
MNNIIFLDIDVFYMFWLELQKHPTFFLFGGTIIYLCGFWIELSCRTISTKWIGNKLHDTTRDLEPTDVWIAVIWPLRMFIYCLQTILYGINMGVILPLALLIGIKYQKTKIYKKIDKICFARF